MAYIPGISRTDLLNMDIIEAKEWVTCAVKMVDLQRDNMTAAIAKAFSGEQS